MKILTLNLDLNDAEKDFISRNKTEYTFPNTYEIEDENYTYFIKVDGYVIMEERPQTYFNPSEENIISDTLKAEVIKVIDENGKVDKDAEIEITLNNY